MRRSFRTQGCFPHDTRSVAPGWYVMPLWGISVAMHHLSRTLRFAGIRCHVGALPWWDIFPEPDASSAADAASGIPFAPTGRPHTSPGGNPGKSHPVIFPRPVGTPHGVGCGMATRRYAAFLQNAFLASSRYPERCSGLVCDAPLGHSLRDASSQNLTPRRQVMPRWGIAVVGRLP
jgi:hypothetical protein